MKHNRNENYSKTNTRIEERKNTGVENQLQEKA